MSSSAPSISDTNTTNVQAESDSGSERNDVDIRIKDPFTHPEFGEKLVLQLPYTLKDDFKAALEAELCWDKHHWTWNPDRHAWTIDAESETAMRTALTDYGLSVGLSATMKRQRETDLPLAAECATESASESENYGGASTEQRESDETDVLWCGWSQDTQRVFIDIRAAALEADELKAVLNAEEVDLEYHVGHGVWHLDGLYSGLAQRRLQDAGYTVGTHDQYDLAR